MISTTQSISVKEKQEKNHLTLIELCRLLSFNQGKSLIDLGERRKQTSSVIHRAEVEGVERFVSEGKVAYKSFDILKILSKTRGLNKNLRELSWEEIYDLHIRAEEEFEKEEEVKGLEKDQTTPTRFANRLKAMLLDTTQKGGSIQKPIKDYYKRLLEETKEMKTNTVVSIFMSHRKAIKEIAKRDLPKKGIFLALKEGQGYKVDLSKALISFTIPEERKGLFKAKQTIAVREKNATLKPLPFPPTELDQFLERLFHCDNILDHALGVLLATGRRSEELLNEGVFKSLKVDSMSLSNIAKKKNEQQKVKFPALWDSRELMCEIELVRKEGVTYSKLYNHCVKNYLELFPSLHSLRKLYGVYSYLRFSDETKHFNLWLNNVMGHEDDALAVSFNYSEYIVPSFDKK